MDAQVASQQLLDFVLVVPQHVRVVSCPVKRRVLLDEVPVFVFVAVDEGRKGRDFSKKVQGVFVVVLPVGRLGDPPLVIELGEDRILLKVQEALGEHRHRVGVLGQPSYELNSLFADFGSLFELVLEIQEFLRG